MRLCSFHHHTHCKFKGTSVKFCKDKMDKEESQGRETGMECQTHAGQFQWCPLTFATALWGKGQSSPFCKSGSKLRDFK